MTSAGEGQAVNGIDRNAMLAFAIPFLFLVPFSSKGFHIDDTHFLRMAQHLQAAPLDYFGYEIHWNGHVGPGFDTNYNPPGVGYLLALAGAIVGWNEVLLHILFAAITGLTALGVYRLAQLLTPQPLIAAAVTALTPGFIVSGSTLMSDMPGLGLYVWGLYFWIAGVDKDRTGWMIAGVALMSLCVLTKYFGITSVALAAVYALMRRKQAGAWCAYLVIPLLVLLLYSLHTQAMYGRSHFLLGREFARAVRDHLDHPLLERVITVVPYAGAMALPWLFFLVLQPGRQGIAFALGLVASIAVGVAASLSDTVQAFYGLEANGAIAYTALVGAGAYLGVVMIAVAVYDALKKRDAASVLLALWLLGTLTYGIAVAPVLGARVLLPAIPAIGMLLARHVPAPKPRARQFIAWTFAGALAVSVLIADYQAADRDAQAAMHAVELAESLEGPLFYYGTWGFQYYLEEHGAQPFVAVQGTYPLKKGMLVVVPQMYEPITIPEPFAQVVADYAIEETWPLATWDARSRAGFYGEFLGRMPFAVDAPRQHHFLIYRVHQD